LSPLLDEAWVLAAVAILPQGEIASAALIHGGFTMSTDTRAQTTADQLIADRLARTINVIEIDTCAARSITNTGTIADDVSAIVDSIVARNLAGMN
jgi:hypothetical protein